jgi:Kef-type K+ transport system membrane component KefB
MHIVIQVLIEILIVIGGSRLVGWGFRSIKQPLVIGEIVAGIALGPSLLGWLAPDLARALFPVATIPFLNVLSQIGLIFFMFLIGLELDPKYLRGNLKTAVITSSVSIILPFSMAIFLASFIYPILSPPSVSILAFTLFLGAAMSITAFPVLARIITESNLQNTRLGTLALTCAAVDDVIAWCLLAVAIAVTRTNNFVEALPTILFTALYIGAMLTVGRWLLKILATHYHRTNKLSQLMLAAIYMGVVTSALITEAIGIHLIFGAFLIGAAMPKDPNLVREVAEKTEDFVLIFLLPIFFAYSGLKTQVGLLNTPELWLLTLLILAVAISGKYVGTYYAARSCKIDKREASALGWLMNTRGLTELIVLNIGLELGVISPVLFTMLVIMALVTTFMTSPLLEWTYPRQSTRLNTLATPSRPFLDPPVVPPTSYRILVPVANPNTQKGLLQLAIAIAHNEHQAAIVNPLSLIELEEDYLFQSTPVEANRLINQRLVRLNAIVDTLEPVEIRSIVQPIVQIGYRVAQKTAAIAALDRTDLVLLGWHRATLIENRLGGRVAQMLKNTPADVAVFIDANADALTDGRSYHTLFVPYTGNSHDDLAVEIALRMLWNDLGRQLKLVQIVSPKSKNLKFSAEVSKLLQDLPDLVSSRIEISSIQSIDPIETIGQISTTLDLTLVGIGRGWGQKKSALDSHTDKLAIQCGSPLIIARRYK